MRDLLLLVVQLIVTLAKLARPGGVRSVIAESLLLRHELIISGRSRRRAPPRELLLRLDGLPIRMGEAPFLTVNQPPLAYEGEDPDKIAYNMGLLCDAGFVAITRSQPALGFGVTGLTWRVREFLDSVRDPEIWRKDHGGNEQSWRFHRGAIGGSGQGCEPASLIDQV
jgi:hypothetical protein